MNDYEKLMVRARKTNAERDAIGWSTSQAEALRTIQAALEVGVKTDDWIRDWNFIFEVLAMLERIIASLPDEL